MVSPKNQRIQKRQIAEVRRRDAMPRILHLIAMQLPGISLLPSPFPYRALQCRLTLFHFPDEAIILGKGRIRKKENRQTDNDSYYFHKHLLSPIPIHRKSHLARHFRIQQIGSPPVLVEQINPPRGRHAKKEMLRDAFHRKQTSRVR